MKKKGIRKIAAFFAAAVLTFSAAAQSFSVTAAVDTTKTDFDLTYKRFDPQLIRDAGEKIKEACQKENNDKEVLSCCKEICSLYYKFSTATYLSMIMQFNNEGSEEYQYEISISDEVNVAVSDALYPILTESEYADIIHDEIPVPIYIAIYQYHDFNETEDKYTQKSAECIGEYNDLVNLLNNGGITLDDFELESARIYLDLIKNYEASVKQQDPDLTLEEYYNKIYNRDYSYDDIAKCKESITDTIGYLYNYSVTSMNMVLSHKDQTALVNYLMTPNEELDIVEDILVKYAQDLSEEYAKYAQYLHDGGLLIKAPDNTAPQAYTFPFIEFNTPVIYLSAPSDADSIIFLIHEFGHFNAFCNTDLQDNDVTGVNLDIAEIQSQGMEVLFLKYYDEIFGEYSDYLKMYMISRLTNVMLLGCYVNDFEHDIFQSPGSFTPKQVVELFHEKQSAYGIPEQLQAPFGGTPNYFNSPYYCISYALSLIPVWKLLETDMTDPEKAEQLYYNYTKIDAYNNDNKFLDSLKKTGFGNIFESDYIDSLRYSISDYCDSVEGILNGDLTGDGVVSAEDLLTLKKIMVQDIEDYDIRIADINRDGKLTASDLAELAYRLAQ